MADTSRMLSALCRRSWSVSRGRTLSKASLKTASLRFFSDRRQETSESSGKTHFGFNTVNEQEKESLVGKVFSSVAPSYDVMNDVMSLGIHRLWKSRLVEKLSPTTDTKLLDVAGGTGDIALRVLDAVKSQYNTLGDVHVSVLDINPAMLQVGRERFKKLGLDKDCPHVTFIEGNAEKLSLIASDSVDAYTIAFGIRNCTHIDQVIREAYRVLKPGGQFLCLEFGKVDNPVLAAAYETYSFRVIPHMGHIIANDRDSYQYLVESIRRFPSQGDFVNMMKTEGFKVLGKGYEDLTFGVATIWSGWKL